MVAEVGTYPLLAKLASEALLPKNQSREERYFHVAQLVLAEPEQSSKNPCDWNVIAKLVEDHDRRFGPAFVPAESDYGPVPFVSWLHLDGRYFRVPTGTYHWSELFLQDVIDKLVALDDIADEKLDATCSNLLEFFLPKIDRFLFDANLKQVDFLTVRDGEDQASSHNRDKVLDAFERNLVIERNSLPKGIIDVFDRIAVSPGDSKFQNAYREQPNLESIPLVRLNSLFVVPFPQHFLPALLHFISEEVQWADNKRAQEPLRAHLLHRIFVGLGAKFGAETLGAKPAINGQPLSDMLVVRDRKIIFINLHINTFKLRPGFASTAAAATLDLWQRSITSPELMIDCFGAKAKLANPHLYEPVFVSIVDGLRHTPTVVFDTEALPPELAHMALSTKALEFILDDSIDEIEVLKFIREWHRLNTRNTVILGSDVLDLYAEFKRTGGFGPRGLFPRATAMMLNPHELSEYLYEKLCTFRREHGLVESGDGAALYSRRYPNVLCKNRSGSRVHWIIETQPIRLQLYSDIPEDERAEEDAVSLYHTWYVAADSLCYHLGRQAQSLGELLAASRHTEITSITAELIAVQELEVTPDVKLSTNGGRLNLEVRFSTSLQQGFARGTNASERLLFNTVIQSLAVAFDDVDFSNVYLGAENDSRFTIRPIPADHVSLLQPVERTRIYKSDDWLVSEIEATALEQNGIGAGSYSEKEILDKLFCPLKALQLELETRVKRYDCDTLVRWCYTQLEAAHIFFTRKKTDLAMNIPTAEFSKPAEEYSNSIAENTELNFALRLLLETALRLQSSSKHIANEEESSVLLAICKRLVELDFLGDSIHLLGGLRDGPLMLAINQWGAVSLEGGSNYAELPASRMIQDHLAALESTCTERNESETDGNLRERLINHFDQPFSEEYGYPLSHRLLVQESLIGLFDETDVPIMSLTPASLIEGIRQLTPLSKAEIEAVLTALELRPENVDPKQHLSPSRYYWRDGRLLNRPLVYLRSRGEFVFSRSVVDWALKIFAKRVLAARFDERKIKSPALKSAYGAWSGKLGDEFRDKVSAVYQRHQWQIDPEVSSVNNKEIPKEGIGPIDIVAIDRANRRLLVVECKRSSFSRNPKDLKTELEKFFGDEDDIGYVSRLLNKKGWICGNLADVAKQYQISDIDEWSIEAVLVTSEYVWAVDAKQPAEMTTYTIDQLERALSPGRFSDHSSVP